MCSIGIVVLKDRLNAAVLAQGTYLGRMVRTDNRQCMGCHDRMGIEKNGCTDCHKEKSGVNDISLQKLYEFKK